MGQITHYVMAAIAEQDVGDIYDYTLGAHGVAQAAVYLSGLDRHLEHLVDNPELGKARPEIRAGLRSFPYEHHIVFYRIMTDHVRVVRVLHESRDMPRYF